MNLGKLVPLEVHGRVGNAKIAKEILSDVKMERALNRWKAKEKGFPNELKNTPIGYPVREIRPREVRGLKVGNSRECLGSGPGVTPTTPRGGGGPAEGCRSICMGEPLRVAARSRY